ncbi:MAG: hypothetical protein MJY53_06135 [Bacteroidales bacterium]|nr:hypothetical protein [Bacteroidales bacterium]
MLQIAKVLKSNGIDGDILIGIRDIEIQDIDLKEPVFIYFDGLPVPFFIESISPKGTGKAIVHITDVNSLKDAEEIVGEGIFIDAEEEDEQENDFIGWEVFDKGERIGAVTGIEPIPGNLCLYIGEKLIPLHEDFIIEADPQKKELFLELPEGIMSL